ncbi:UNVERIFIED_CONTAM: putative purine permease 22 [Sesamum radiatum]|uniref:Probable purine permease n=1 Tax=Sesamum radiatum TaxID=300843 RepID=A0AAW2LQE5_SESRA
MEYTWRFWDLNVLVADVVGEANMSNNFVENRHVPFLDFSHRTSTFIFTGKFNMKNRNGEVLVAFAYAFDVVTMEEIEEPDFRSIVEEAEEGSMSSNTANTIPEYTIPQPKNKTRWAWMFTCTLFVLLGQSSATLLGRLYYNEGGNAVLLAALLETIGFPILIPFALYFSIQDLSRDDAAVNDQPSNLIRAAVYIFLGLFQAATVLLTISSALLIFHSDSEQPAGRSNRGHFAVGFSCSLVASALYSFNAINDTASLSKVLAMICSGGKLGAIGLIFEVSSLFTNVISTVGLPIVPILAAIFFHEKMDGIKVSSWLFGALLLMFISIISITAAKSRNAGENLKVVEEPSVATNFIS